MGSRATPGAYSLAEDHIPAVLQAQVRGYGGSAVLHEQEDHCLLGLVTHHGHTVCESGQQGVKGLTPFTWARERRRVRRKTLRIRFYKFSKLPDPNPHTAPLPLPPLLHLLSLLGPSSGPELALNSAWNQPSLQPSGLKLFQ